MSLTRNLIRVTVAAAVIVVALSKRTREDPSDLPDWLECDSQGSDSDSGTVSATQAALVLEIKSTGHMLKIPARSAPVGTRFKMTNVVGTKPAVDIVVEPHGTVLNPPATLTLKYPIKCIRKKPNIFAYRIWRQDESDQWHRKGGSHTGPAFRVSVDLPSFSTYALAAN
ncbi:hypothetical protein BH23GEM8_BH23GEM8_15850 [soil metagenome]